VLVRDDDLNDRGWGDFHSGNVQGRMGCRQTTRDGEPAVECAWDGNAETDAAQGRGRAVPRGDEPHRMIFFHGGGSGFAAKRKSRRSGQSTLPGVMAWPSPCQGLLRFT
jgi:hypothetical protein